VVFRQARFLGEIVEGRRLAHVVDEQLERPAHAGMSDTAEAATDAGSAAFKTSSVVASESAFSMESPLSCDLTEAARRARSSECGPDSIGAVRKRSPPEIPMAPATRSELLARLAASVRSQESGDSIEKALSEATTELVLNAAEPASGRRFGSVAHTGVRRALGAARRQTCASRRPSTISPRKRACRNTTSCGASVTRSASLRYRYRKLLRVIEARRLLKAASPSRRRQGKRTSPTPRT